MQADKHNHVHLIGRLSELRRRWMPDGSLAAAGALLLPRPPLGAQRAVQPDEQPLPLRATGKLAEQLLAHAGAQVEIKGVLRRRYFRREGEPYWGQVEIWVEQCRPLNNEEVLI